MAARVSTPWFSYAGRNSTLTHFLVACLSSGAAAQHRFACLLMTAKAFGWRKAAFQRAVRVVAQRHRAGKSNRGVSSAVTHSCRQSRYDCCSDVATSQLERREKVLRSATFSVTLLLCRSNGGTADGRLAALT